MIENENVHRSFGPLAVLKGVSLAVRKGAVVTVIGGSGSGKSTLLTCINGLQRIRSGRTLVDRMDVHAAGTGLPRLRRKIGIAFKQFSAFAHLTVRENVTRAPRKVRGLDRAKADEVAMRHLSHVGLADKRDVYPSRLSGGRRQRMAIARALAMSPDYMLFDEVTSVLEPQPMGAVLDTLRMLACEGLAMICIAHKMKFAREVSDRVAFFRKGAIAGMAPPEALFAASESAGSQKFFAATH